MNIGCEHIVEFVTAIAKPAVELHVVYSRCHIGQGKHHRGVFLLPVHALACPVLDAIA